VWIATGVVMVAAFALSPPVWRPFLSVTPGGRVFHKLAASETVIVAGVLWLAIRDVIRRAARGRV
jgi:hypothetical protein